MAYDDFATYFTSAFAVRVADDRWTKLTVRSRWQDTSAGGGPGHASWRDNYQWLLTLPRDTQLTMELSLPDPRLSNAAAVATFPPIGFLIEQGNGGADARRRRLRHAPSSVVYEAEPQLRRRLQYTFRLPRSPEGAPYVVVPYALTPGAESAFNLKILLDDANDDGVADLTLEPVSEKEDWHVRRLKGEWGAASAAPGAPAFAKNAHMALSFEQGTTTAKGGRATAGRVFICVETVGFSSDMRTQEGMQQGTRYPSIGVAVLPGCNAVPETVPPNAIHGGPEATDGVWIETTLPVGGLPHLIVPYLAAGEHAPPGVQFVITAYSDLPLAAAAADPNGWECETCQPPGQFGHVGPCPNRLMFEKLCRFEEELDDRLAFLQAMLRGDADPRNFGQPAGAR